VDRIAAARRQRFVGRGIECALFREALTAQILSFQILHIVGPGGVGKTTLLKEFVALAVENQHTAHYVDARNLEPSPQSFLNVLSQAMDLNRSESPLEVIIHLPQRQAYLIDTWDIHPSLVNLLRDSFLPQLTDNTLLF
jgi:ABC-type Mn2+/Zn2+ transport system ATPase subunit